MKQGERVANVFETRTLIFDYKVFSNAVFRINSFNEVLSIRHCWFCCMSNSVLFSDYGLNSLSFKKKYRRNILVQSHTVPMGVLKHKVNVSFFIDLTALCMNP